MELWTGELSRWKCHWPDLKTAGLFRRNLFQNSLKPQHSNPNPIPLANQLRCIDFLTTTTPLIIPQTPCLPWISYATRKLMLDLCKMVKNGLKHSIRFCGIFSKFQTILLHIVLLKFPHVQIAFLKFSSCDNQVFVGCIPIVSVAVHLNWNHKNRSVIS